jgi:hypothetical protein
MLLLALVRPSSIVSPENPAGKHKNAHKHVLTAQTAQTLDRTVLVRAALLYRPAIQCRAAALPCQGGSLFRGAEGLVYVGFDVLHVLKADG